jgi:hypothetical protein
MARIEYNGSTIESGEGVLTITGDVVRVYPTIEEAAKGVAITDSGGAFERATMDLYATWKESNIKDPVEYAKKVIRQLDWFKG